MYKIAAAPLDLAAVYTRDGVWRELKIAKNQLRDNDRMI